MLPNKVRRPGFKFSHTLTDIRRTLNHKAINEAFYDVTAISFTPTQYLQDNYTLMSCGGMLGEGYGPHDRLDAQAHGSIR